MHILRTDVNGNPNVGLYGYANNQYCIIGNDFSKEAKKIEEVLKVPVHVMNICGTSLVGAFLAGNSNCLLVPEIILDSEVKKLRKLGIHFKIIESKLTALGNNVLCNNQGALVNPEFSARVKKYIRQALGVKVVPGTLAELETPGSAAVFNSKFGIVHNITPKVEIKELYDLFGVKFEPATVNYGNPYLSSGMFCNDNGFVIGKVSTGFELTHIDESLGFLK